MKTFLTKWGIIAGIALFFALVGSAAIPAVFPQTAFLAKPLLCPSGEMTTESETFHPEPGRTVISRYFFCTDANGVRHELPTLLTLGACTAVGFVPALLVLGVMMGRAKAEFPSAPSTAASATGAVYAPGSGALKERLKELAEARAAGLITDEEFEEKKKEGSCSEQV